VRELRELVATSGQILYEQQLVDYLGHSSARVPETDHVVIKPKHSPTTRGMHTLTADDMIVIDLDGNLVEGAAKPPLEFHIHSEVYRARPDVNAVFHTHPKWSTFLTMTGHAYKPVYAQGVLLGDMPVMDSPMSVNTKPMGEKLAALLGDKPAALLKAHGVVVVGRDILECFALAAYVEENAYRQYMAMQIGEPYVFSAEEQAACREKLWTPNLFQKTWDHYYSKLPLPKREEQG
jgi:L-fuculose-phosphate aldolase